MDRELLSRLLRRSRGMASVDSFVRKRLPLLSALKRFALLPSLDHHIQALALFGKRPHEQARRVEVPVPPLEYVVPRGAPDDADSATHRTDRGEASARPWYQRFRPGPLTDESRPLDPRIHRLISRWLRTRLPLVHLHTGALTDLALRRHRAEAMAVGRHVFIRSDKYDLHRPEGLGLLAHEMTHVGQQDGSAGVPAPFHGREEEALQNERQVLHDARLPLARAALTPPRQEVTPLPPAVSAPSRSARPMFAEEGRQASPVAPESPPAMSGAGLSESQVQRLKEELYRDLRWRIKTDFERGS